MNRTELSDENTISDNEKFSPFDMLSESNPFFCFIRISR